MGSMLQTDIPVIKFIYKLVMTILLGVLCLLSCLPLVTLGPAITALYYTLVKSVRHEKGDFIKTYAYAFRTNLKKGTVLSVLLLGYTLIVLLGTYICAQLSASMELFTVLQYITGAMLLPSLLLFPYLFPVLSRFEYNSCREYLRNCLYLSIRHFPYTLLFAVLLYGSAVLLFVMPAARPFAYAMPGISCMLVSIPMEKIFRLYMPKPDADLRPDEVPWYWE